MTRSNVGGTTSLQGSASLSVEVRIPLPLVHLISLRQADTSASPKKKSLISHRLEPRPHKQTVRLQTRHPRPLPLPRQRVCRRKSPRQCRRPRTDRDPLLAKRTRFARRGGGDVVAGGGTDAEVWTTGGGGEGDRVFAQQRGVVHHGEFQRFFLSLTFLSSPLQSPIVAFAPALPLTVRTCFHLTQGVVLPVDGGLTA